MIYCPYTDRSVPRSSATSEHILPLSLGGVDGLEIPVDSELNSKLGSALDGALANEFVWELNRTRYDARGHSGKEPMATIKRASHGEDNRPAQAHFHAKHGICLWDAMSRQSMKNVGTFHISLSMNIDLPMRFVAKTGLSAGYFVYRDLFRDHVDHRQLRDIMLTDLAQLDLTKGAAELGIDHLTARIDSWMHEGPSGEDWQIDLLRRFCSAVRGSVAVLLPGPDCFAVGVGLLGQYLAMVNVPALTESFPNKGDFHWGHVLAAVDGKLWRCSWLSAVIQWLEIDPGIPQSRLDIFKAP